MNCIVLLYIYIIYYSPLNLLDIGLKQLLLLSVFKDNLFSDSQLLTLLSSFDTFYSTLIPEKSSR